MAIARTNSVDLLQQLDESGSTASTPGYAIFPQFSLFNHSCMANCRYSITSDNTRITVRAMRSISKGEELTISYIGVTLGNIIRKRSFKSNWKFVCCCKRCCDPTELGTFLQAIRCSKCRQQNTDGYMLPDSHNQSTGSAIEQDENEPEWKCATCTHKMSDVDVRVLLGELLQKTESMSYALPSNVWEELLQDIQSNLLHPNLSLSQFRLKLSECKLS